MSQNLNLPPLPWSDDPKHIAGQRKADENTAKAFEVLIKLSNHLGLHEGCSRKDCRRYKKCNWNKKVKTGRFQGLMMQAPPCSEIYKQEIRAFLGNPKELKNV